jgi:hypothetical protein
MLGVSPRLRLGVAIALACTFGGTAVSLLASRTARAQSIRDAVRQHVSEGLEGDPSKPPPKPKPKPKSQAKAKSKPPPSTTANGAAPPTGDPPPARPTPADAPPEEALPKRVFGKNFQLDPKIGIGYRGWYPAQYPRVSIAHAGYYTWSLDVKAKLFGFLRLHRGYYESNGVKGPRTDGAVVAQNVGKLIPKAAWLLGALGVPISRRWETLISYETRTFVTTARPSQPVAVVSHATSPDTDFGTLTRNDQPLEFVSGFETLVLGVRYSPDAPANGGSSLMGESGRGIPPMYLGIGFTQFSKPYQVSVGTDALDELLFNGRFRGAGLAYGLSFPRRLGRPYLDLDSQLGLGQVRLLDDLSLNELLPQDWLIGYLQGNVTLGYALPVLKTRPTPIITGELTAGGSTFFYFETEDGGAERPPAMPLNWDFLWAAHIAFSLPL